MYTRLLITILAVLTFVIPTSTAHAGGIVSVCDETHLLTALAGGGTVVFSCSGTITLTAAITIATNTTISGTQQDVSISGNHAVRVFTVNPGVTLILKELTIADGAVTYPFRGGGIYNNGTVIVSNSSFTDNEADYGGAIFSTGGTVIVNSSTFSGNNAQHGGGITNVLGELTVSNSTFAVNTAVATGGGIANYNGTVVLSNNTFSNNVAQRGSIYNGPGGTVTLKNTIVANSQAGNNCFGTVTNGGGNLSYPDTTCPGINGDPLLSPLQNNGGPTKTMTFSPGSAALEAGNDAICATNPVNSHDQRGVTRPQGPHCDIGAVELQELRLWLPAVRSE